MTNDEVERLIKNLAVAKLEERDAQEVAGYYETLDIISESFRDIDITENNLKMLHNILMKHSEKDAWHRGNYKQHSNVVEATQADGSKQVIFRTADPGFATEDAMRQLIGWYNGDNTTPPIVRAAIFVYDFLSIHPFQDGNGRLSKTAECTWFFQLSRAHSRKGEISKLLSCSGAGAYLANQTLPGKFVNLSFQVQQEERPARRNTWLSTAQGWKPCVPKEGWQQCQEPPVFGTFRMDGRECTVYPKCKE